MKQVALACTGGGVKSAINIGVIRELKELEIEITAISGASIGACVAILYAMGYTPKEMLGLYKENMITYGHFSKKDVLCGIPNLMLRGGIKNPNIIIRSIEHLTRDTKFHQMKDFKIPVIIPALDITKRETVYYSSVNLKEGTCYTNQRISEAIKSSSTFPVVFIPNKVKIKNEIHHMMDGGITCNVPVLPLKEVSDFVIGIEAKYYNTKERRKIHFFTAFTETFQAMRRSALVHQKKRQIYGLK